MKLWPSYLPMWEASCAQKSHADIVRNCNVSCAAGIFPLWQNSALVFWIQALLNGREIADIPSAIKTLPSSVPVSNQVIPPGMGSTLKTYPGTLVRWFHVGLLCEA